MKTPFFLLFLALSAGAKNPDSQPHSNTSLCGPIPAVCYPGTQQGGMGIVYVELNQISNSSAIPAILEDFTCTDSTWLTPGMSYIFQVTTGQTYEETVKAWIDFNNDGDFQGSEIIYQDSAILYNHIGAVYIPPVVPNSFIPLRMRVGSDYAGGYFTGCTNMLYGQYEDYTIYFGAGVGIVENTNELSSVVAPNPFQTSARLVIDNVYYPVTLKIFNTKGVLVSEQLIRSEKDYLIKRNELPAGLYYYLLSVSFGDIVTKGNFVIN